MLMVEEAVTIKILYEQGKSIRAIAKALNISRNTVKRYIRGEITEPIYSPRDIKPQKLDPYKGYLKQRVNSASPDWIPATVLYREIHAQGYKGGLTRLRYYLSTLKPCVKNQELIRFETAPGKQMQIDWAEFQRGKNRLCALVATLGYSRMSYVEFVNNQKIETLLHCLMNAFEYFGGITQDLLFDNMKTVVIERDAYGQGEHRFHQSLWDFAKHCGFIPKLCRPYRAQTKGKVERFIGYLRRSFYVPLRSLLNQAGMQIDEAIANNEVKHWLHAQANQRLHATTHVRPIDRWQEERIVLQPLPQPYQGVIWSPKSESISKAFLPVDMITQYASDCLQHSLDIYQQLLH